MAYHFFRRRPHSLIELGGKPSTSELQSGLQILQSILGFGLLLKPEANAILAGRKFISPRICFTELSIDRLSERTADFGRQRRNHFEIFGPFAIGIANQKCRELGFSSIRYVTSDVNTFDHCYLKVLRELHNTLVILSHVESKAHPGEYFPQPKRWALPQEKLADLGIQFFNEEKEVVSEVMGRLSDLAQHDARQFELLLGNSKRPFWQLAEQISLVIDMLQDADSQNVKEKRHLAYYRQQEWRMLRLQHHELVWVPLAETDIGIFGISDEGKKFRKAFHDFWGERYRGDRDWLLVRIGEKRLSHFIDEVIYPDCCSAGIDATFAWLEQQGISLTAKLTPYRMGDKFS